MPTDLECVDAVTGEWRKRTPEEVRAIAARGARTQQPISADREALAKHLYFKFATTPLLWENAPEARKDLWRRYADQALKVALPPHERQREAE